MAEPQQIQKPSYTEWVKWAQVTVDRLTTIVHIYKKPPYLDAYMPELVSQERVASAIKTFTSAVQIT